MYSMYSFSHIQIKAMIVHKVLQIKAMIVHKVLQIKAMIVHKVCKKTVRVETQMPT